MNKLCILFLIAIILFQACGSKTEKKSKEALSTVETLEKDSVDISPVPKRDTTVADLLATLPIREFPFVDSTNFDNFEKVGVPDDGFLKSIKFRPKSEGAKNFRLNYKIPSSERFNGIVITFQNGDHELFTFLITVSKDGEVIDNLEIAYDEIAESAFRKTSKIKKGKIVVTDENWMSEEPAFKTNVYVLEADGTFKNLPSL